MASTWHALQTRCTAEAYVHSRLASAGIEDLYPTYSEKRRYWDRRKVVQRPLFPGYLFVAGGLPELRQALDLPHVLRVVGLVETSEIDALRALGRNGAPTAYNPAPGDEVEVRAGSMAGLHGFVERFNRHIDWLEVIVRMPLLLAAAAVRVAVQDLRLVRRATPARAN